MQRTPAVCGIDCMSSLTRHIPEIFLFDSLTPEQSERVSDFCSLVKIRKGDHLFFEGEKAAAFFYIISGRVKIYKLSPQGMEQILEIHAAGSLVAEAAIFDCETFPAYCQALQDCTLIRIPRQDFIGFIEKNPSIALKIIHAYSRRLRHFVALTAKLSMHDIKSRLARYLLDNSTRENDKRVCVLTISKKELAAVLGTIPETLSRTLRHFKDENMIGEAQNAIIIKDMRKLKTLL